MAPKEVDKKKQEYIRGGMGEEQPKQARALAANEDMNRYGSHQTRHIAGKDKGKKALFRVRKTLFARELLMAGE